MIPGNEMASEKTPLAVTAYPLSHGTPYQSTAFLVKSGDACLLYLGDTGADSVEHSDKLHRLWQVAGPLIQAGKLKAIFIEVSFPLEQPDKSLFGHLTPHWLMEEMKDLEQLAGPGGLKGLPVVITHMKPGSDHGDQEAIIRRQLTAYNPMQLRLIFPVQGQRLEF
jgi:3',5'-cyclic-nucleotide phosphodiesterase